MMVCGKRLRLVILHAAGKGRQLCSSKQKGFTREADVSRAVCYLTPKQHWVAGLRSRRRVLLCSVQAWPLSLANPTFQNNLGFHPIFS